MRKIALTLLSGVALFPALLSAQETLQKSYSDAELIQILENEGYRAVQKIADGQLRIRVDGHSYELLIYDDNDLQLYYGLTGYELDVADLNEWNRTKRLSRGYLDSVDDPVLEADLLANAGYTPRQFLEWIEVFLYSAAEFRAFITERNGARQQTQI